MLFFEYCFICLNLGVCDWKVWLNHPLQDDILIQLLIIKVLYSAQFFALVRFLSPQLMKAIFQVDEDGIFWRQKKSDDELAWSQRSAHVKSQLIQCFSESLIYIIPQFLINFLLSHYLSCVWVCLLICIMHDVQLSMAGFSVLYIF